jgi:hypothetical protein
MRHFPLAHMNYVAPGELRGSEQHKLKILSAIRHLSGIGKVLRHVELDLEKMADTAYDRANELEEFNEGIQAIGDLIGILTDTAWSEIEEMASQKNVTPPTVSHNTGE